MGEKMRLEKILALSIALYLAIALPMHFFNSQSVQQCEQACSEQGYNVVLNATATGEEIECRCFDSFSRFEKYIKIST